MREQGGRDGRIPVARQSMTAPSASASVRWTSRHTTMPMPGCAARVSAESTWSHHALLMSISEAPSVRAGS
ncbi:hypothetical protein BC477_02275 [Clavibacter michiganensis subsp. michiganensis]|uniref:Uncharacterized protein n=1 Tax=Clavibacter michiganensis subsp. michiganensis TaxID=33013 RepID=A0A251XJC9_CLAMM|nr:hypothetical protein BC477_02275 [Clavibacter michiganensis subsp. michiganensis]OUE03537.1 hypothetical protein CMMCAS07_01210 [Clavibacter michiganensis subsp. michiganensis]